MKMNREAYLKHASFLASRNKLPEALAVYDEAIAAHTRDSDLFNCKGVCLRNLARPDDAMECYDKALEIDPTNASACNNKGVIFKEREDYDKAIECYLAALRFDPSHKTASTNLAVALTDLGTKLKSEGRIRDALKHYDEAISHDPSYAPCFYNLGVIHSEMANYAKAMEMYGAAVKLNPRYVECYNNMGAICKNQGELHQAIEHYERALAINPNFEMSKGNLAVALTDFGTQVKLQGDVKEGIRLYKRALVYNAHYADAYYNLGVAYGEHYKYDKALVYYQLAITFNARCAEAYNNLGVIYKDKENLDKAIHYYTKALEVNPNFAQTLNNIGVIYTVLGRMTEAHEYTKKAIEVNPTYAEAYNNLGVLYRDQGDVALAVQAYEKCISIEPTSRNALQNRLLALNYLDDVSVDEIYAASAEWGTMFAQSRTQYKSWKCDFSDPNRVLKIGYIGPDFFTHSVSYFIHAPLKYHDRKKVKVYVYSNVIKEDDKTQIFKQMVPVWRPVAGVSEADVAKMVHEDEIDILVELTGHTANNRLDVMAFKPAPIQVTWIGYPNTTGLPTIDYRFTDGLVDPPNSKQKYVEELVRLPKSFLCYTPFSDCPEASPPPAVENGFVTFGSFNNLAKIGPQVVKLWSRILRKVPNSRLLVKAKPFANSAIHKKFAALFEREGIPMERLDLMGLIPLCSDHLKTYGMMDIALDTFPYAGTTTTCESLLMGVPVVVLKTQSNHAHNVGVTLLSNIGISELITDNEDDYVDVAVRLAKNMDRLTAYRMSISKMMISSPLCDGKTFASDLENVYRDLFQRHCEKKSGKSNKSSSSTAPSASSSGTLPSSKGDFSRVPSSSTSSSVLSSSSCNREIRSSSPSSSLSEKSSAAVPSHVKGADEKTEGQGSMSSSTSGGSPNDKANSTTLVSAAAAESTSSVSNDGSSGSKDHAVTK